MKASSANAEPKPVDKPTAWACALANAATLPGLGTIAGGRKIGYVQAALALVGFALTLLGLVGHMREWMARGEMPEEFTFGLRLGLLGMAVFGTAWLWALRSSLELHRGAARPPVLPPVHVPPATSNLPPKL